MPPLSTERSLVLGPPLRAGADATYHRLAAGPGEQRVLRTASPRSFLDSAAPADPSQAEGVLHLASIHRELAANDPHAGVTSGRAGSIADRTVELRLSAPFPLAG